MAEIRGYIAASLDGYIATVDGSAAWLEPFQAFDDGYDRFIAEIGTTVMGRTTYDQTMREWGWPYPGKAGVVLTHRPLDGAPDRVRAWSGDLGRLAAELQSTSSGDIWIVGGAATLQAFLERGLLDRMEILVLPRLLGRGIRLWPVTDMAHALRLDAAETLPGGMVRLCYRVDRTDEAGPHPSSGMP